MADFRNKVPLKTRIEAVKAHALKNYEKAGAWDTVIETMDDWDIAAVIEGTSNEKGAIWKMACEIKPFGDYRVDIVASGY